MVSDIEDNTLTWKWMSVEYSEVRNAKRFIGQIIKSDVNYIKYLKSTAFDKNVWPEMYGIDAVHKPSIIDILNKPQMDRRSTLAFFTKHLGYNSCSLYTVLGFNCSCFPM